MADIHNDNNGIREAVHALKRDRDDIFLRLREKDLEVNSAMKDIESLKTNVGSLNKDVAQIQNSVAKVAGAFLLIAFLAPFLARWVFG